MKIEIVNAVFNITLLIALAIQQIFIARQKHILKITMEAQIDLAEAMREQEKVISKTLEDVLIFQKKNRIPICELLIKDCLEYEDFEGAKYWENYKQNCIKEAKKQKK
jgi:hypothetical protein